MRGSWFRTCRRRPAHGRHSWPARPSCLKGGGLPLARGGTIKTVDDNYKDTCSPADDHDDRDDDQHASAKDESDPLAELARLIGQTDPFGSMGRANQKVQPPTSARAPYQQPAAPDYEPPPACPPARMMRAST